MAKEDKFKVEGKVVKVCHDIYEVDLALPNDKTATIFAHVLVECERTSFVFYRAIQW